MSDATEETEEIHRRLERVDRLLDQLDAVQLDIVRRRDLTEQARRAIRAARQLLQPSITWPRSAN